MSQAAVAVRRRRQLVVTINGPGEIAAWLYPVSLALKARMPDLQICVCLLPCVFSSGAELGVLEALETVDAACTTSQSYGLIVKNRLPEGFARDADTLLFHFGGEVALTRAIAWRLGCDMYAYADALMPARRKFRKVFYSGLNPPPAGAGIDPGAMVGELMVDAARIYRAATDASGDDRTTIAVYPGSREYMVRHLLPFLAAAADDLALRHPDLRFVIAKSDFVRDAFLRDFPEPVSPRSWRAHKVVYDGSSGRPRMRTEAGTELELMSNSEVLARADFAVSLPGTNTGEMAAAGIPMVVIVPTHMAEKAPLPGLAGHVGRLPLAGARLKRFLAQKELARTPLLAQPNRRAGRKLVPEITGLIEPSDVAAALEGFLSGDRAALSREVREAMGQPGAADRLADEVVAYFAGDSDA